MTNLQFLLIGSKKTMDIPKVKNSSATTSVCGTLKITIFMMITNRNIHIH
jgi:hypothetical protein